MFSRFSGWFSKFQVFSRSGRDGREIPGFSRFFQVVATLQWTKVQIPWLCTSIIFLVRFNIILEIQTEASNILDVFFYINFAKWWLHYEIMLIVIIYYFLIYWNENKFHLRSLNFSFMKPKMEQKEIFSKLSWISDEWWNPYGKCTVMNRMPKRIKKRKGHILGLKAVLRL